MKKLSILAAASVAISTSAAAAPGNSDSAMGAATAEVVAPITITHDTGAELNFGTFVAGTTGGTVTVSQLGVGTTSGDTTHVATSVESADSFTVTGDPLRTFAIAADPGTVAETGGATMAFTTDAPAVGALLAGGTFNFNVGGTLTVAANQAPGVYTGDYEVRVNYN